MRVSSNDFIVFHIVPMILLYCDNKTKYFYSLTGFLSILSCQAFIFRNMKDKINWNDSRCFKTWNYRFSEEETSDLIIVSYAVLLGDYSYIAKKAALLLLKILVRDDFLAFLMSDTEAVYPFDRNDSSVRHWKKEVLKKGICEVCGSIEHLEAHHILGWANYPRGRADIKNGECLCHKCHTKQHINDPSYYMMLAKYK